MGYWKALLVVTGLCCVINTTMAQVSTSAMVGTITDPLGAVIGGATVTVTDVATGVERTVPTNADGSYVVENIKPGTYEISIAKAGFKKQTLTGITVQVGQRARIDINMVVGSAGEHVEVQSEAPVVETEMATIGKVIDEKEVIELPLNGRNFLQLATLTPGVQTYTGSNSSSFTDTGGAISANGMSAWSNTPMIDGIYNQDTGYSRMNFSPSVDMIEEFKIQTNTYDAEFGMAGGAQINIITKRGSSTYHGSAYEFLRNNKLDASPYFQPGALPHFERNQFGGTFGGHIFGLKKDFFFFSYEGMRSNEGLTYLLSLPTPAIKAGNFSDVSTIIYDPATYDPSTGLRQPFKDNIIPADRISPQALYFNQFYPDPTPGAGYTNNLVSNPVQVASDNDVSFRYDRDFSDKDSVTVRYSRKHIFRTIPNGDCGCTTPIAGFGEQDNVWGQNHKVGWTHIFSPTMVNSLNLGFSQYYEIRSNQDQGKNFIAAAGIQGVDPSVQAGGFPSQQISGWTPLSDSYVSGVNSPQNNYIIGDTLSKVVGKHSLKLGGEWILDTAPLTFNLITSGLTFYDPVYSTQGPNAAGDQFNAFADYLLGVPDSSLIFLKQLRLNIKESWADWFFQDNWNISKNLTLNLGLRYEIFGRPYDVGNRITSFDVTNQQWIYPGSVPTGPGVPANSVTAASVGLPRSIQDPTTYNNWAPRIGFAWRPFANDKTVLRGGFGMFYNWTVTDLVTNQGAGAVPFDPASSITCNSDVPCITSANPFSTTVVASTGGQATDGRNRTPYDLQYSLGIQREITPTFGIEVGYVGNKGIKNWFTYQFNQPIAGPGDIASRSPFPQYSGLSGPVDWGSSHYDSLQIHARKRAGAGLTFMGSYTWGHALGNAVSGPEYEETFPYRNYHNWRADYGNTNYDVRQILSLSWVYELPIGRGKRLAGNISPVLNLLVGGWKFGGIAAFNSGLYLTPADVVDVSNTGGGSRPDTIGGCNPNHQSHPSRSAAVNQWFNTACFQRAALYTFGNTSTGSIKGPGLANFDLSGYKQFDIAEGKHLEFRGEFFNAFNRPNLGNPGMDFGTGDFGVISSSLPGREIQFGLRFDF